MLSIDHVSVEFTHKKKGSVQAVKDVSLSIKPGDIYGIIGFSGAGKSTLIRTVNMLQTPSTGEVYFSGKCMNRLSERALREERKRIGMIFQHFNLLESKTVLENVLFPLKHARLSNREKRDKALKLLAYVGLQDKWRNYPRELSGGQKQRVAIARALANDPELLLCDEATSSLDPQTTAEILALLKRLNRELGLTILLITHEMNVIKELCNRVGVMEEGELIEQGNLVDIFTNPSHLITKKFIGSVHQSEETLEKVKKNLGENLKDEMLLQLSYRGESTTKPLLSELTSFGVVPNIMSGTIEFLQDVPVGSLLITLGGKKADQEQALAYLKAEGVTYDILDKEKPHGFF